MTCFNGPYLFCLTICFEQKRKIMHISHKYSMLYLFVWIVFLERLHFSEEELLLYPSVRISVGVSIQMQNVRANVKVMKFQSLCIFSCILTVLIILIKPQITKAHDRRTSGYCGTSGYAPAWKVLWGHLVIRLVCLFVCLIFRNSIPLTYRMYVSWMWVSVPNCPKSDNWYLICSRSPVILIWPG